MKILVITNIFPNSKNPDAGTYVADQVNSLKPFAAIKVVSKSQRSPLGFFPFMLKILWATLFSKYDLIHAHYGFHSALLPVLLRRQPLVVTFHGSDAFVEPERNWLYRYLQHRVVWHAAHLVAVSPQIQAHLVEKLGAAGEKISIIPCGVDTERFRFRPKLAARQQLGLKPDARVALYIGRLTHAKGVDLIEQAARHFKPVDFYFIGTGPLRWQSPNCQFIGLVDHEQIPQWLNAADVLLLPSRSEGTPVTVLEALASETPVICSAVGACPQLIDDGVTGLLIAVNDARALTIAIQKIFGGMKFDTSRGRNLVAQNYDLKVVAEKLRALYATVGQVNNLSYK